MSRFEAAAYVELADDTIRRAWRYQLIWHALEAGRVPSKLIREVLDRRFAVQRVQAIRAFEQWANSAASDVPLIVEGPMGRGKSYAAARWLCSVAERGESVAWLSAFELGRLPFDRDRKREADRDIVTLADEERRGLKACATVIDDIGAGALSPTVMTRINGVLLTREGSGLSTAVLMNSSKSATEGKKTNAEVMEFVRASIDPRLLDRMRTRGVQVVRLGSGKSMREAVLDAEKVDDPRGRGQAWFASARLMLTVGVLDDFDNTTWTPDQQRVVMQPAFGHALQGHARRPDWPNVLEGLCETAGINVEAVRRRAAEIEREEQALRERIENVDTEIADGTVRGASGFLAKLIQDIAAKQDRDDPEQSSRKDRQTVRDVPSGPEPAFADGERQRLVALGYRVHRCTTLVMTEEFELRHTRPLPAPNGRDPKRTKQRLLSIHPTEARAWDAARQLQAVVVSDDPETNGSWHTEKATA